MELPDLGKHCCESTCKQLDFLPFKCDACKDVFCKNHFTYDQHKCKFAYKKDVQVPVCPTCNNPIPLRKGEKPDIVVGEHRARNCQPDSAHGKQKIFKNRCVKAGCKKKELIKVVCDHCQENFCIKHRHPVDHDCKGGVRILSKAGHAAIMRAQETCDAARSKSAMGETATDQKPQSISASLLPRSCGMSFAATCYNGLSEEEVLRRVLEVSLTETTKKNDEKSSTNDEDVASPSTTIDEGIQAQNKKIAVGGQ